MKYLKLFSISTLTCLLTVSICNPVKAQCNIVSGMTGTVHDNASTISINYDVTLTTGAMFFNIGSFTACGFAFPGITAPWSGNTGVVNTVTYTFSSPITSIDVFVAYVGVNTLIAPESFEFTTNGSIPVLTVDSGSCAAWTVVGNEITSPSILNGVNAIVNVQSVLPFTTISITSGLNSNQTGGSSYGLCDASVTTGVHNLSALENNILVYPNPVSNELTISFDNGNHDLSIELVNLLGEVVSERKEIHSHESKLDVSNLACGIYFAEITIDGSKIYKRIYKN